MWAGTVSFFPPSSPPARATRRCFSCCLYRRHTFLARRAHSQHLKPACFEGRGRKNDGGVGVGGSDSASPIFCLGRTQRSRCTDKNLNHDGSGVLELPFSVEPFGRIFHNQAKVKQTTRKTEYQHTQIWR